MRSRRQTHIHERVQLQRDSQQRTAILIALACLAVSIIVVYTTPIAAAPTSSPVPATAIIIPLGTEAPAVIPVNSTIIPLATFVPGAPPPALVITPRSAHPATSTPPPTSTANPRARTAIAGTPRPNTSSPPLPGDPAKGTPTRAARVPGQFTRPPAVPTLPVVPAATPAPTTTPVPTSTLAYSASTRTVAASVPPATATIAPIETETATPLALPSPSYPSGGDLLPSVAAAVTRDLLPRSTQPPLGPPAPPATLTPARDRIGSIVALSMLVIALGGVGIAGGCWAIWRVRRETRLARTQKIEEIR